MINTRPNYLKKTNLNHANYTAEKTVLKMNLIRISSFQIKLKQ